MTDTTRPRSAQPRGPYRYGYAPESGAPRPSRPPSTPATADGARLRARERLIGGAGALRTLAVQVSNHPDQRVWSTAEVVQLLVDSAAVLDQAVTGP